MSLRMMSVAELQRSVTNYSAPKATLLAILDASVGSDVNEWASCTVGLAAWSRTSRKSLVLLWRCTFNLEFVSAFPFCMLRTTYEQPGEYVVLIPGQSEAICSPALSPAPVSKTCS